MTTDLVPLVFMEADERPPESGAPEARRWEPAQEPEAVGVPATLNVIRSGDELTIEVFTTDRVHGRLVVVIIGEQSETQHVVASLPEPSDTRPRSVVLVLPWTGSPPAVAAMALLR
jgi:hypothetical protein